MIRSRITNFCLDVPKSTICEILSGKKYLSRQMIRKFADYFRVDASVLAANF